MAVTVSTMFVPVHDPDAALGIYRDALGLEVGNDVAADGFALLSLVTLGSLQEPVSQPWGARDCAFGDPSGKLVRLAQA